MRGPFIDREAVERYLSEPKIECLLCGRRFKVLGAHLSTSHNVTASQYRLKFNIPGKYALVAPGVSQIFAAAVPERTSFRRRPDNRQKGTVASLSGPHGNAVRCEMVRKEDIKRKAEQSLKAMAFNGRKPIKNASLQNLVFMAESLVKSNR